SHGCCQASGRCCSASACSSRCASCRARSRSPAPGISSPARRCLSYRARAARCHHGRWAFRSASVSSWWPACFTSRWEPKMAKTETEAPFAYEGLDRVIHEKARLGILTSLMAHPKGLAFADLKQLCGLTDGNLSRHLQVLEEAK